MYCFCGYDLLGKLYTLLLVNPDVPFPNIGTEHRPLIHWMVINMAAGSVESGQEILTYIGPSPPYGFSHTYYYLLYEHPETITVHVSEYTGDCDGPISDR